MIQDIAPHHLNNHYDPNRRPDADSRVFSFKGGAVLVLKGDILDFPRALLYPDTDMVYLFSIDEESYFLSRESLPESDSAEYRETRALRQTTPLPKYRSFAVLTAWHLYAWYRDARFCGRCGKEMRHSQTERCMVCPDCGYHQYPRIMPAVIVGVRCGDRLLVTHYKTGFRHSALIAGFTEIGETAEETVAREVMEECGIRVKNIRYYKSQPWGSANDLLLGYYCDADGETDIRLDESELGDAAWVTRDEIVLQPDDYSLTNEMMTRFKEGLA